MVSCEMPKYKCQEQVWALQIKGVVPRYTSDPLGGVLFEGCVLEFEEKPYAPIHAEADWCNTHNPKPGMFMVTHTDGRVDVMSENDFVRNFTRI